MSAATKKHEWQHKPEMDSADGIRMWRCASCAWWCGTLPGDEGPPKVDEEHPCEGKKVTP